MTLSDWILMQLDDLLNQLADTPSGASRKDLVSGVWHTLDERRRRLRRITLVAHSCAFIGLVSGSFLVSHSQAQTALNQQVIAIALSQSMASMEAY